MLTLLLSYIAALALVHAASDQALETTPAPAQVLNWDIKTCPCQVNTVFYPNGQWRLGRGFPVERGNKLTSSQTHYKPRVFIECDEDYRNDTRLLLVLHSLPQNIQNNIKQPIENTEEVLPIMPKVKSIDETGHVVYRGWLHWMVTDIPLYCESSGCQKSGSSVKGIPIHPSKGSLLASYVPPGRAESYNSSTSSSEKDQRSPLDRIYVISIYLMEHHDVLNVAYPSNIPLEPTSSSMFARSTYFTENSLFSEHAPHNRLLGVNYFLGSPDAMATMQFVDLKKANHGIIHMNRAVEQRMVNEDL